MTKLRVSDLAAEFGISSDEVLGMLRAMDVVVRSHLTPLTDNQISRARARWEREKRVRAHKAAEAPASGRQTRRGSAVAEAARAPPKKATAKTAAKSRARKRSRSPREVEPADSAQRCAGVARRLVRNRPKRRPRRTSSTPCRLPSPRSWRPRRQSAPRRHRHLNSRRRSRRRSPRSPARRRSLPRRRVLRHHRPCFRRDRPGRLPRRRRLRWCRGARPPPSVRVLAPSCRVLREGGRPRRAACPCPRAPSPRPPRVAD